jgi:hypothetical protein
MKVRFLFLVMLLSISLIACSQENDRAMFSCDEEIEAQIRENLAEIRTYSREQYLRAANGDREWEISLWMAITPEQRKAFKVEKLEETLLLNWNERESEHIRSMLDFVKATEFFDFEKYPVPPKEAEILEYRWVKYAQEELNWSDAIIYSVGVTLYPATDTVGGVQTLENNEYKLPRSTSSAETIRNCVCSYSYECPASRSCIETNCHVVRRCGSFGFATCYGECQILIGLEGCRDGRVCRVCCPDAVPPACPPFDPDDRTIVFPHPNSRVHFFMCVNGVAICHKCPEGLVWNQELETCDWPS